MKIIDILNLHPLNTKVLLPILGTIKFSNGYMQYTDLDINVKSKISYNNIECCIPYAVFKKFIKTYGEDDLIFKKVDDGKIEIRKYDASIIVDTLDMQNFPKIEFNEKKTRSLKIQPDFKEAIKFISTDGTRYYLNGVNFSSKGIASTDGIRLFYKKVISRKKFNVIFPSYFVKCINKINQEANFELGEIKTRITFDNVEIIGKNIDGIFPDFERVIPENKKKSKINRVEFLRILKESKIISGKAIMLKDNSVIMKSDEKVFKHKFCCGLPEIGFYRKHLISVMSSIKSEEIEIEHEGNATPIKITEGLKTYVLMPTRL